LWNEVYVKAEGGYELQSPTSIARQDMTIGKAVDTALFLLQAGGKYLELATGGTSELDRPVIGPVIDAALIINLLEPQLYLHRIGATYGRDYEYERLTRTLDKCETE